MSRAYHPSNMQSKSKGMHYCCSLSVASLQENLESATGITVSEVVKSGSLEHGTAVQGNFDIDLVIHSKGKPSSAVNSQGTHVCYSKSKISRHHSIDINAHEMARKGKRTWTDTVKSFLRQTLGEQVTIKRGKIKHAVKFQYKGIAADLLVSPYWDRPRDFYKFLCSLSEETRDE